MQSSADEDDELDRVRKEFAAYKDTAAAAVAAAATAAAATADRLHSQQVCLQAALRHMCRQALGR